MIDNEFLKKADCMLCEDASDSSPAIDNAFAVDCERCGRFVIEGMLVPKLHTISERHLLSGCMRERTELQPGQRVELTLDNYSRVLKTAPTTISEKGHRILTAMARRSSFFGEVITFHLHNDFPLGYARNSWEFEALLGYLIEGSFVVKKVRADGTIDVSLTAKGFDAIQSRLLLPPLTVFISSTCHDLVDLRAELRAFLDGHGFAVKVSEDTDLFNVDPAQNAIETCLQNLEASDVVVCILDGRYGGIISAGEYEGLSATQVEIRHARSHRPPKPVYTFIRERVMSDLRLLQTNEETDTLWVEPADKEKRTKWRTFAEELTSLPREGEGEYSNWVDLFKDSVELKKLVMKRLAQYQREVSQ